MSEIILKLSKPLKQTQPISYIVRFNYNPLERMKESLSFPTKSNPLFSKTFYEKQRGK